MENKDLINSYRNEHIDGLIAFYQDCWRKCSAADYAVISAYYDTNDKGYRTFTAERIPTTTDDLGEFTAQLIEAGITEFIITDASSTLMTILVQMMRFNWVIVDTFEDEQRGYPIRGLKVRYFR